MSGVGGSVGGHPSGQAWVLGRAGMVRYKTIMPQWPSCKERCNPPLHPPATASSPLCLARLAARSARVSFASSPEPSPSDSPSDSRAGPAANRAISDLHEPAEVMQQRHAMPCSATSLKQPMPCRCQHAQAAKPFAHMRARASSCCTEPHPASHAMSCPAMLQYASSCRGHAMPMPAAGR